MVRISHILMVLSLVSALTAGCGDKAPEPIPKATATGAAVHKPAGDRKVLDTAGLEALSIKILEAYKAKDVRTLAELGPPNAKEALIFLEPRNPNYAKLLGDDTWRMRSLASWDGKVRGIQVGIGVAKIHYNDHPDDPDKITVLEVVPHDGKWVFHDLVEAPAASFRAGTVK